MTLAIEIEGLTKTYRARRQVVRAVDDLHLAVPAGGVFGFLGPNGSGKTTTIRALIGHLRANSGELRMLGHRVPAQLSAVIDRVGALVEVPSFFPGFSGRRNLRLLARSRRMPPSRVDAVLDTVGLADRAESRVSSYSLGMRQRLGVAAALLKDPEVLILDEPANGLDPAGIREMRALLRRLGSEGRTVFVSSHLLSEVEQLCDRVGIIASGHAVATGRVDEILAGPVTRFRVRVPGERAGLAAAAAALREAGFSVADGDRGDLLVEVVDADAARITRTLASAGVFLRELSPVERTLEAVFLELTGEATEP